MLEYSIQAAAAAYFTLQSVIQFIAYSPSHSTGINIMSSPKVFPRNFQRSHKTGHEMKFGSQN